MAKLQTIVHGGDKLGRSRWDGIRHEDTDSVVVWSSCVATTTCTFDDSMRWFWELLQWNHIVTQRLPVYRGVYRKGVGRTMSHILKVRVWQVGHLGYAFLIDRCYSCCIRHPSNACSKQRLFEASITVCLCKQYIAQYCGDSDNRTRVSNYPNHTAGLKSKIVPPCSAQTMWSVFHRVRCGGVDLRSIVHGGS